MSEWEILQGSVFGRLAELPDGIAQCCITSPPYFGLRDYGTAEWEGGDPACSHRVGGAVEDQKAPRRHRITGVRPMKDVSTCGLCGAIRIDEQIGLERTPDLYAAKMVEVFQEVRRVLRDDGVVWLNLGDSYNAYNGNSGPGSGIDGPGRARNTQRPALATGHGLRVGSLKPKDLLGIPWLVAFALREDGWFLRSDVIWHKPNPMPESVVDRPTSAHEHVFLLSKSDTYYYDSYAIREESDPDQEAHNRRYAKVYDGPGTDPANGQPGNVNNGGIHSRPGPPGRNKRNVWTVATRPYPDAHFATFPEALILPMVLAGSAPQACSTCGAPWARVVERSDQGWNGSKYGERKVESNGGVQSGGTERSTLGSSNGKGDGQPESAGWKPTCSHSEGGGAFVDSRSLRGQRHDAGRRHRSRPRRARRRAEPRVCRARAPAHVGRHGAAVRWPVGSPCEREEAQGRRMCCGLWATGCPTTSCSTSVVAFTVCRYARRGRGDVAGSTRTSTPCPSPLWQRVSVRLLSHIFIP